MIEDFDGCSKIYYSPNKWVEYGNHYRYVETEPEINLNGEKNYITVGAKQSKKCRITGSIVNKCINNYGDKMLVARQIAGIYNEQFTQESIDRMNHGIKYEDTARKWYTSVTGNTIIPSYFAVPKSDYRLGAEHDGFVDNSDGIIEIKCPAKMYQSIINKQNAQKICNEELNYSHIPESHYDQMQMELEIFDKNWCDYIVYSTSENIVHLERVYRNNYHWKVMYEKIEIFINSKLKPLLIELESDYPYNPAEELNNI